MGDVALRRKSASAKSKAKKRMPATKPAASRARPVERIADYRRRDQALALLLRSSSGGVSTFEAGAQALAMGLGYRWAGVGRIVDDGRRAELVAFWDTDAFGELFSYPLAGTPCGDVAKKQRYCLFRDDVAGRFPDDPMLADLGAVSYQGEVYADDDGRRLGYVFAANDRPERRKLGAQRDFVGLVAGWVGGELQRRGAEEALRASQQRLMDIAEAASDWFWEMDADLRFSYLSERLTTVTNIETESVLGRTRREVATENGTERKWRRHLADLDAHRPFRDFQYSMVLADGSVRHLKTSGKPIFDADGAFAGYRGTGSDITAEVEARERAERAEIQLQHAIDGTSEGFALFDAEDRMVLCNERFREIYADVADLYVTGARFEDIVREAARRGVYASDENALEGYVAERLARHGNPSGTWEQMLSNGQCVQVSERRTEDGGVVGLWTDITHLKRQEQELAQKSATLETIMQNIVQGISLVDKDLNLLAFNDRFLELLEFPGDRFHTGDPFEKFIRYNAERGEYGPGDVDELVRERVEIAKRFEPHCFERSRPDGTVIEVRGKPLSGGGFVTAYTDVTELRRNERALEEKSQLLGATLDNMAQGLVVFDADLTILAANERAAQLLQLPAELLAVGASFSAVIRHAADRGDYGPGDADALYEKYRSLTRSSGITQHQRELPDGCILEIQGYPRPDGGFVATYTDVTEFKRAEETLARLNEDLRANAEDLERSNGELEQFAYVASHDLQEPLRMVASYCQLLQRRYQDQLDEDANEFIGFAVDGANRMQRLINDLLAYSRVGTRGKPLEPTDLGQVYEQTLLNLRVAIEESAAEVTADPLPTLPADTTQLAQLFQNLIGNAIKFRTEAAPVIHVGARQSDGNWVFSVSDNGIGIDPQYAERIFMIFQRLHGAGEYAGTGIGLAVCKKIVERHGGQIWMESEPGQGTTFFFTLPTEGAADE